MSTPSSITLRIATAEDHVALAELAALDCAARLPGGTALMAEVDDRVRAALFVDDGSTIADPFFCTALLVDLLRAYADLLRAHAQLAPMAAEHPAQTVTVTAPAQSPVSRLVNWFTGLWAELDYAQRRSLEARLGMPFTGETRDRAAWALIQHLNALYAYEPPGFEHE